MTKQNLLPNNYIYRGKNVDFVTMASQCGCNNITPELVLVASKTILKLHVNWIYDSTNFGRFFFFVFVDKAGLTDIERQ